MLLTIDTSAGTAVAVVDPDSRRVLAERSTDDSRRHAEVIGPFLAEVLAEAGIGPERITGVVAGMGPGPFTGLRVGIAAARTFAAARHIPLLPLVSHDAVAAEHDALAAEHAADADAAQGERGGFVVLTDARRREVYWSAYATAGDTDDPGRASRPSVPRRTAGPGLAKPADLDAVLGGTAVLGDATVPGDTAALPRITAATIPAGRLGLLAAELLADGSAFAADEPLYLRDPDVTMPGAPKRVRA